MMIAAWIALSSVGFVLSLLDTLKAYSRWNLASVAVKRDDPLIDLARSTTIVQGANTLMFGIFLTMGVVAVTSHGYVMPWLMFTANGLLVLSAVQQHLFRRRIYRDERINESG